MSFIGHLNNSVAGLGDPFPSGLDLTSNKTICVSIGIYALFSAFTSRIQCMLPSVHCFGYRYACSMVSCFTEFFELFLNKLPPASGIIFLGIHILIKKDFTC